MSSDVMYMVKLHCMKFSIVIKMLYFLKVSFITFLYTIFSHDLTYFYLERARPRLELMVLMASEFPTSILFSPESSLHVPSLHLLFLSCLQLLTALQM